MTEPEILKAYCEVLEKHGPFSFEEAQWLLKNRRRFSRMPFFGKLAWEARDRAVKKGWKL